MATSIEDVKKRLSKPEDQHDYYNILIYGPSGVGKTSLYYDAKDTLVLDVEHGTEVIKKDSYYGKKDYESEVTILQLTSWEDLQGVFAGLQSGELTFTNVILDSITDIRELCKDHVLATQKRNRVSEDTPSQQDWGVISERMRKMLRNFRSLPINTIIIAREYTNKDADTGTERIKPAVGGKLEDDLPGMMNITVYMTVTTDGKRVACFDLTGKYYAKDRTNRFPKMLENPTWLDFEKALPELKPLRQTA
jgi:phage nucleotide-binding protein